MIKTDKIPLFPINLTILPGEKIPLHIFEVRYRKMIADCLKTKSGFGILFKNKDKITNIGTKVKVVKVYKEYDDGKYDILVQGEERFFVKNFLKDSDLWYGEIQYYEEMYEMVDKERFSNVLDKYLRLLLTLNIDHDIQNEINKSTSFDFTKNILIPNDIKQEFLELSNEEARIDFIDQFLDTINHKAKNKNLNFDKGKLPN